MTLILAPLLLDGRKHLGLHERRHGNGEPVLAGDVHRGDRPARLQGAATVGAQPGAEGCLPRFAKGRCPYITNGVSLLQTNKSNSTSQPYCNSHALPPSW